MEKALSSIKKYKKEAILGPIFKMLEVFFELITPFLMRFIVNEGINVATPENLWPIIYPSLIILGLCILGFLSTLVCQYFASVATWGCGEDIRNRLYLKIGSLSSKEINKIGANTLVTVVTNDVLKVQNGISMAIRLALRAPCLVIGALICSFILNWRIALIFLAIIPLIIIVYFVVLKYSTRQLTKVQKRTDEITQIASDSLRGTRVIKGFNKENETENRFNKETEGYFKESKTNAFLNAIINPFTFLVINTAITLIIVFSGNLVFQVGDTSFIASGDLVALVSYLNQILIALVVVCNLVVIFTKAFASNKRINEVFSIETSIINNKKYDKIDINDSEELYKFENVSLSYGNDINVVENISFTINKGETIGIVGGTGSGKSTLVRLLNRFFDPTSGEIFYKGVNLKDYDLDIYKDEIGFVPQKNVLFRGTIRSNFELSKEGINDIDIEEALKFAEAYYFVNAKKEKYDEEVKEGGKNFSGGQRQRLCIARAIIKNPEVLIMDDSTSALDNITERNIRNNISKRKGLTTIIISQKISSVHQADKILVIDNGKLIDIGSHNELIERCEFYKDMAISQSR